MSVFSLADFMGCPPVGAVRGVHRHRLRRGTLLVDGSARGEDFYLATSADFPLAMREDLEVATREDFFMAMDTGVRS
jgi:hypothetical protein